MKGLEDLEVEDLFLSNEEVELEAFEDARPWRKRLPVEIWRQEGSEHQQRHPQMIQIPRMSEFPFFTAQPNPLTSR